MNASNPLRKICGRVAYAAGVVLCLGISAPVHAEKLTSSIAKSISGDEFAWATRTTQIIANKVALEICNEKTSNRDCELLHTKAVVRAEGTSRLGIGISAISLEAATKIALENCGEADCKVVYKLTEPGFYAVFKTTGNFFIQHQDRNLDDVVQSGKEFCEKKNINKKCELFSSGVIPGSVVTKNSAASKAKSKVPEKNCRPRTASVNCSSKCYNGDCMVTYNNGCQMRVQVSPMFDPFSNQWKYPPPRC